MQERNCARVWHNDEGDDDAFFDDDHVMLHPQINALLDSRLSLHPNNANDAN